MAVAFHAPDTERCADGQVLQQGNRAEVHEVLAAHDPAAPRLFFLEMDKQARIGDTLEDTLAVFVASADVAEGEGLSQAIQLAVRFIDDDRWAELPGSHIDCRLQSDASMERLLDE